MAELVNLFIRLFNRNSFFISYILGFEKTVEESLKWLDVKYIDQYLIHAPQGILK